MIGVRFLQGGLKVDNEKRDISVLTADEPWLVPFLGRQVIREGGDSECIFDCDYFPDESAALRDIVFFVHFTTKNGILTGFEYQKYKDLSKGHGRPHPDDQRLNAADKTRLSSLLAANTIPRAEPVLEKLLERAKKEGFPGWRLKKENRTKLVFASTEDGAEETVTRKNLLKALEWSFFYIEVLDDPDFWLANSKALDQAHEGLIRSLFSLIDRHIYPELEEQNKAREYRNKRSWEHVYLRQLREAARNNDLEGVRENIQFAGRRLSIWEAGAGQMPALAWAAKNGNAAMVRLLVEHRAYREESFKYEGEWRVAAAFAIEQKNDEILDLLIANPENRVAFYIGDRSMLTAALKTGSADIIKKVASLSTESLDISDIEDPEILSALSFNRRQVFSVEQLRVLYSAGYYAAAARVMDATYQPLRLGLKNVILKEAMEKGLAETKYVYEKVYSQFPATLIDVFTGHWPAARHTVEDNEQALEFLLSSRMEKPQAGREDARTLAFNSETRKLVEFAVRHCSRDTAIRLINTYWPDLDDSVSRKMIRNMIRCYKPEEAEVYFNSLPPETARADGSEGID